ncbi:preprotein translocase subunit YajC [Desulforamulus hydrothermalis]|uniref:Protein translocase subunit yajC n=1 Tax=Desulforamulus hydrothermalis Lam5 = DSM 18033 TaxID=1121428 RepID=K8DXD5_9FIRM|nr:preprotein translocase subunit YajC [Desulforamulus hydrothermalis]CCO07224.1 Protein translocase subunit yajC [Desulforamulus hydrothermalis Lam5 = DSM 18033]SHG87612.1 protein translocase subunit yajC [Desulforamulus hydrothermalis Lam5 = DSM 18033]
MDLGPQTASIIYIVALFAILYFLMIRPQQKRQKQHAAMIKALNIGDNIITVGGLLGSIVKIKDNTVVIRVADKVHIEVLKNAIAQVTEKKETE